MSQNESQKHLITVRAVRREDRTLAPSTATRPSPNWAAVTCPECLARRAIELADRELERAAAPRGLCLGDCADTGTEASPSFVSKVDEDGLCVTCGGDVVLVALGDAEAIMRALEAARCTCKPAPRHVETCAQHDASRP
jgi:hypothetical protein